MQYDYSQPKATRAFLCCPETGATREISVIELKDGGRIEFPRDFSSTADAESIQKALPKITPCLLEDAAQNSRAGSHFSQLLAVSIAAAIRLPSVWIASYIKKRKTMMNARP